MSRILGSKELINENTQQELADQWLAQTLSTSDDFNPFITDDFTDQRGRRGSVERHENFQSKSPDGVSLLGGILSGAIPSPAVRTIVAEPETVYFAPFGNQGADNTTVNSSPEAEFPGGYAFTQKNLDDLSAQGLNPRDPSSVVGEPEGSLPTLLDVARFVADNFITGQFVKIDGNDFTPLNIEEYRQETDDNLTYDQLPRSTGVIYTSEGVFAEFSGSAEIVIVADADLGKNLDNEEPSDDIFPTLAEINPSLTESVVPLVQAGDYFGLELSPGAHTVQFGATGFGQDVTYNILNPIIGTNRKDFLKGTQQGDYIEGRDGRDILWGQKGDDLLLGGNNQDILAGGKDSDELWGDQGLDLFLYFKSDGMDKVFDLEKGEVIKVFGLEDVDAEPDMSNERNSTKFDFGGGDILTIVGVIPEELEFTPTFFGGTITLH